MKRSIMKPQSKYGKSVVREAKRKAMPYAEADGLLIYKPETMNVGMYVKGRRLNNDQFRRANGLA